MKLIIKLLAIAILGAVALLVAGYFLIPPAANKAVDEGSRYAFGVSAEIGKIKASPGISSTNVGFENYVLQSPTGFNAPLLSIGEFSLGFGTKSIIGETKDVGELVLSGVNLNLIQDGVTQSNLLPVLRHIQGLGGSDEAQAPDGPREGSPGPKLKIGSIRVENVGATINLKGIPGIEPIEKTFMVPNYEKDLSSLTGAEGRTVAEIMAHVVDDLKARALSAGEGHIPAPALNALGKVLDGGLEGGLQGGLDTAKDLIQSGAAEQIDAAEQKANDLLKDGQKKVDGAVKEGQKKVDGALKGATKDLEKKASDILGKDGADLLKGLGGSTEGAAKKASDKAKDGLKGLFGSKKKD